MATEHSATMEQIRAVKQAYETQLLNMPNVVGVGIGYRSRGGMRTKTPALIVMVSKKIPSELLAPSDLIPSEIEGVPVDVQEVGELRALASR